MTTVASSPEIRWLLYDALEERLEVIFAPPGSATGVYIAFPGSVDQAHADFASWLADATTGQHQAEGDSAP